MKKLICIVLSILMLISILSVVGCSKEEPKVSFGLGVYSEATKATNAEGETNGQGAVSITAAAITVDADGKVVACDVDTADITVSYTSEGKAVANDSFKTKRELGDGYNMKAYGGAAKEWFEQADAFETVVIGKTLDEIKALVADADKGTDEVVNAGCTIMVADFVLAIEKAFANAKESDATAASKVTLGAYTEQKTQDADGDKAGYNQIETTFVAGATDAEGTIVAASSDCVQVQFTFTAAGASTYEIKDIKSKKEAGANYGMSSYGVDLNGDGEVKEWFEQAAAFDTACVGKKAGDLNALLGENGYANSELQTAGCTIAINAFVKAAAKIG